MTTINQCRDFLEKLFALKIAEPQRLQYLRDPYMLFTGDLLARRRIQVASILAILIHIMLFLIVFPSFGNRVFQPTEVLILRNLAKPARLMGGEPPKPRAAAKPKVRKPKPTVIPIPDPTPSEPEPIRRKEIQETPQIQDEILAELNIGDITAPPSSSLSRERGVGLEGRGAGSQSGPGSATGDGSGVYTLGGGVTNPEIIEQTIPSYTDQAIRAKVQGIVLFQAIIRKNGRVDSFKVLRGLGHGLEEKAIKEISTRWRFRPGTLNGNPVDVLATIEVTFNLR